jgi:mitochondrial import receptor subunit TOM40
LDQPLDGSNVYDRKRRNVLSLAALTGRTVAQCDTAAPPPPPPPVDPSSKALPPPPPDVAAEDSIAQAAAQASAYSNPGPYEQASMETKRLLQLDTFDGFRCDINKQVSPFMVAVHNFHLGTTTHAPQATNPQAPPPNSTYHFVTQVADEGGVFMTRVDFQRQGFDGRFQRMLGPGMVKFQGGVTAAGDGQTDQLLMEYDTGGMTWTANAKYGSMGGGLLYGMNYLQAVTPQLTMGAEGMFLSANNALLSNYTAKYTFRAPHTDASDLVATKASPPAGPPGAPSPPKSGASTICLNYHSGQQALTVGYQRVVTPQRVTVGAELQCSPFTLDSQILVGAEFQLLRSKLNVAVDGEGRLQSLLEARLGRAPNAPRLTFSADMDHAKSQMKFGYGLTVDSS